MIATAVHDLLRVDANVLDADPAAPAWARASLARAPWVVTRRFVAGATIAVGVRGPARAQRFATHLEPARIRERVTPFALAARLPIVETRLARAAHAARDAAAIAGLTFGIAGSYGFELASGVGTTHAASDLDAIVAAADRATLVAFARACADITAETGVRLDIEVAYDAGGAALADVVASNAHILLKTPSGPRLVPCPA